MTELFARIFIKDHNNIKNPVTRRAYGTMSGFVGIGANILLVIFKMIAGVISGSIAITADAVNNLSDAASQVVSVISFKISSKPADRDHPFGHARIEYVASMIVSFLIVFLQMPFSKCFATWLWLVATRHQPSFQCCRKQIG